MSNKHVNHQHGLHDVHGRMPKQKLWKRGNKNKHRANKAVLFAALDKAITEAKA